MKQKLQRLRRLALQHRVSVYTGGKPKTFAHGPSSRPYRVYITPAEALAHGGGFVQPKALAAHQPVEPHVQYQMIERVEVYLSPALGR